jgi:hypothetical protein
LGAGGVASTVQIHAQPPAEFAAIVARFLSFPAFEITRFMGLDTAERLLLLRREPWVLPFALIALVAGVAQPLLMAALWFRRGDDAWRRIKWLSLATVVWIYASFFFSVRGPLAHAFYVVFPIAALYAFYGWRWVAGPRLWRMAALVLFSGVALHVAIVVWQLPRRSLYRDRALVQAAIDAKNDRLLGDRRDSVVERIDHRARPSDGVDADAYATAGALDDLELVRADWDPILGGRVSRFAVTIEHRGRHAAYVDIRFTTTYRDEAGEVVAGREGVIKEILEPGDRRTWPDLTDGMVPEGAVSATLTLTSAEKVIPDRVHEMQPRSTRRHEDDTKKTPRAHFPPPAAASNARCSVTASVISVPLWPDPRQGGRVPGSVRGREDLQFGHRPVLLGILAELGEPQVAGFAAAE